MKTVDKAFTVLDQFSPGQTELGLTELARLSGLDKAATRRLLVALAAHGFIEQVPETRKYRLGHGFLRLARIREATVPITRAAQDACDWLVAQVGETVHASLPGRDGMISIAHRLPDRAHVVNIIPSQILPFHATASGLAFLTFASAETRARILDMPRARLTEATATSAEALAEATAEFRAQGYSQTRNSFEIDVSSVAMPFFRDGVDPAGSLAIALPRNDLTDARREAVVPQLIEAVRRLELALTGL